MSKVSKKSQDLVRKVIKERAFLVIKLLLECWNHPAPHFGGDGPNRYDGSEKYCAYCNRPKGWKPVNAGYWASEIADGAEVTHE